MPSSTQSTGGVPGLRAVLTLALLLCSVLALTVAAPRAARAATQPWDGFYTIKTISPQLCITAPASPGNGSVLHLGSTNCTYYDQPFDYTSSTQWWARNDSLGTMLVLYNTNYCIDTANGSTAAGATFVVGTCNSTSRTQHFLTNAEQWDRLTNVGSGLCMNESAAPDGTGAKYLQARSCGSAQDFADWYVETGFVLPDPGRLTNLRVLGTSATAFCATVLDRVNGGAVFLPGARRPFSLVNQCLAKSGRVDNNVNWRWTTLPDDDVVSELGKATLSGTNLCLTAPQVVSGAGVTASTCTGQVNQQWRLTTDSRLHPNADRNLCLTGYANPDANGDYPLRLYPCSSWAWNQVTTIAYTD